MGLFDEVTNFFSDNAGDAVQGATDAVQNVTDGASQLMEENGVQDAVQNVTEQAGDLAQPAEEAQQQASDWLDQLTGK